MKTHFNTLILFLITLLQFQASNAQFDKGIQLNTPDATPGYLLFDNDVRTYLVDNCGDIVHQWDQVSNTQLHPKLFDNGDLLFLRRNSINKANWDGSTTLLFSSSIPEFRFHYELIPLANGNILTIGRRELPTALAIQYGWTNNDRPREYDVIVEVDLDALEIVWEWRVLDHSIQNQHSDALNFGNVEDHPELLDINAISRFDWGSEAFMINGMDYNPELDQIVLSMRKLSEVVIIDHSTTTAEAASHTGGVHDKGGDILYRWGNPQNYGRGDASDRELSFQHNPNWIQHGPHKDKIIIFNNGLERTVSSQTGNFSAVDIIQPPIDENGNYHLDSIDAFGPVEVDWRYVDTTSVNNFYSGYTSSAKVLPNLNILVTEGVNNRVFELTPEKEKVWEYIVSPGNYIFRTEKYPADFPAFDGRDLTPSGTVESPPSDYDCELISATTFYPSAKNTIDLRFYSEHIEILNPSLIKYNATIFSIQGIQMATISSMADFHTYSSNELASGHYIIMIQSDQSRHTIKFYVGPK